MNGIGFINLTRKSADLDNGDSICNTELVIF